MTRTYTPSLNLIDIDVSGEKNESIYSSNKHIDELLKLDFLD